jgi:DNA-binding transcriptional ArsR family regulator
MKDDIKGLSEVFRLLGEPNRLRILLSLGLECRPVSAVIAATGLSQTNVSFHLRTLREAGLVRGEPNGPFVFYCLADPTLLSLIDDVGRWQAQRSAASVSSLPKAPEAPQRSEPRAPARRARHRA